MSNTPRIPDLIRQYGFTEQSSGLDSGGYDDAVAAMIRYEQQHGGLPASLSSEALAPPYPEHPGVVEPVPSPSAGPVQRQIAIAGEPQPVSRSQVEKIGQRDPRSRRQVLQPSKSILNNERLGLRRPLPSCSASLPVWRGSCRVWSWRGFVRRRIQHES